jgi:hypothetical protein
MSAVTGKPFSNARRVEVARTLERPGDVQLTASVDAAVASGDVSLVSFWTRSGHVREATLAAGFKAGGKSETVRVSLPREGAKVESALERGQRVRL